MIAAAKPANEKERIAALHEYDILDTMPEKEYDDITKIAADICGMPMSLITLIGDERQWFKSKIGIDGDDTSRDVAFCAHAILTPAELFMVNDSSKDERFFDNPFVTGIPHVGFYAGVPLMAENGSAVGTLCVLDNKPNDLTNEQKETLRALARQVVANFEVRRMNHLLQTQKQEMEQLNADLSRFAHVAAHDIKSPCSSIAMCATYMKDHYADKMDADGKMFLEMMETTALSAIKMVNGILQHTQQINTGEIQKESFTFDSLITELKALITLPAEFTFSHTGSISELYTSRSVLLQILSNLCNNAIKYNDKDNGSIEVSLTDTDTHYSFEVIDNGPGISKDNQEKIFELFSTLGVPDRFNNMGTGIGLSTVKRLVEKMGGEVSVTSEIGKGSSFCFTISK